MPPHEKEFSDHQLLNISLVIHHMLKSPPRQSGHFVKVFHLDCIGLNLLLIIAVVTIFVSTFHFLGLEDAN